MIEELIERNPKRRVLYLLGVRGFPRVLNFIILWVLLGVEIRKMIFPSNQVNDEPILEFMISGIVIIIYSLFAVAISFWSSTSFSNYLQYAGFLVLGSVMYLVVGLSGVLYLLFLGISLAVVITLAGYQALVEELKKNK